MDVQQNGCRQATLILLPFFLLSILLTEVSYIPTES